jgi:hypothetical protein
MANANRSHLSATLSRSRRSLGRQHSPRVRSEPQPLSLPVVPLPYYRWSSLGGKDDTDRLSRREHHVYPWGRPSPLASAGAWLRSRRSFCRLSWRAGGLDRPGHHLLPQQPLRCVLAPQDRHLALSARSELSPWRRTGPEASQASLLALNPCVSGDSAKCFQGRPLATSNRSMHSFGTSCTEASLVPGPVALSLSLASRPRRATQWRSQN